MSRSNFILGITMLVVTGTLAFMVSFERSDNDNPNTSFVDPSNPTSKSPTNSSRPRGSENRAEKAKSLRGTETTLSLPKSATSHLNHKQLVRVDEIVSRVRQESRENLDKLTRQYGLAKGQQQKIFPLIVAHHDSSHPSMMVDGQSLPTVAPGATFDEDLYSQLNSSQQDEFTDTALDHDAWWEDIVIQLEDDLDNAIDNGEMVPTTSDEINDAGVIVSEGPAEGDGESSSHSGGNLFDLLGP